VIGAVTVAHDVAFVAHSDGDVLLHALIDSLLGAMGMDDIGQLFPDTDPQYAGIRSSELLARVLERMQAARFAIVNIDCVVVAERPKISPFKEQIRHTVADLLHVPYDAFNVKAKTKEQMDAVGRGEAIECFCVCMLKQSA
jgi:2-C-methyl-D-erythritol 2,4-cyclodiphosphate synthase